MITFIYIFSGLILLYLILSFINWNKRRTFYKNYLTKFDSSYNIKIGEPFETTLSGVKHNDCEEIIKSNLKKLRPGSVVLLVPDPKNNYDKTATKVTLKNGEMLGWLPNKEWNDRIFLDLMKGKRWEATVTKVLKPCNEFNNFNLLINLQELGNS